MSKHVVASTGPLLAVLVALASGCPNDVANVCPDGDTTCTTEPGGEPPRLYVDPPFGVGFTCVTIGCDERRPMMIENRGGGTARLALVRLAVDASADFGVERADGEALPVAEAQVDLAAGEALELTVSFSPTDGQADEGEVWIDWYDGAVAYEDAHVERIAIPLSSRVLGNATATTAGDTLMFGYVATGSSSTLPFVVENDGDAVLQVGPVSLDATSAASFSIVATETLFVNPGETAQVQVVFAPTVAEAAFGTLYVETNDAARPRIPVSLLGTAIADPRISIVEPVAVPAAVDFGQVRIDDERTREIIVMNLGGQPLEVTPRLVAGAESGFAVDTATSAARVTVYPLTTERITVSLRPAAGGPLPGRVVLGANDPLTPETDVALAAYGAAPTAIVDPASLEFGQIVQGWITEAQAIGIRNGGTGDLTISGVSFELGSSSQIQLASVPALPVKLSNTDPPLQISVYVTATTLGDQTGTLLIETDQIGGGDGIIRIPVHALVVDCATGCPTTNGTPDCSAGRCEIGTCLPGYHDADTITGTGCECQEDQIGNLVQDIGEQCGPGLDLGTLNDNGGTEETSRSGTLHGSDDIDLYFYRANDTSQFLSDDYGARVELLSAPPGLEICVRFNDAGNGCGGIIPDVLSNECSTSVRDGGGNGTGDDSQDIMVWVRWQQGASPMCGAYNIKFRANDG